MTRGCAPVPRPRPPGEIWCARARPSAQGGLSRSAPEGAAKLYRGQLLRIKRKQKPHAGPAHQGGGEVFRAPRARLQQSSTPITF